ncbi:MAG: hypothetical protein ABW208_18390 [Pyrinomonadaceae bacterium]
MLLDEQRGQTLPLGLPSARGKGSSSSTSVSVRIARVSIAEA